MTRLSISFFFLQIFPDFPAGEVNVSLSFDQGTSRLRVSIVKARNLCCKAREGKKQDKCGVSCSGDIGVPTPAFTVIAKPLMAT